ncbi:NUDIX domain-containing protein [Paenibacillus psychroresistens]|uniref:NUDIX domain-containing protein n=1 Tax=Paenibacillus psychroresistens TaxID=1778678 RepID=A0A6B8RL58_9BACL|nr:NUDIX domain-containing protein [Paenibacillus psychroresistens]QGQ96494.1 NUDIX domain-containing protein [Paenibacillus psychroresistens]
MESDYVYKVTAYITRFNKGNQQLLVFKEKDYEHLGFQVPGGTVEKNEDLQAAIIREIKEEAGINEVSNVKYLGEFTYNMEKPDRIIKRYYYQMQADSPEYFTHIVQSDDEDNGWIYEYSWLDLKEKPTLFNHLGVHLDKVSNHL